MAPVAVLLVALVGCGPGGTAVRVAGLQEAARTASIPWRALPAPPSPSPASASDVRPCARDRLRLSTDVGAYHGDDVQVVRLRNVGAQACRLSGAVVVRAGGLSNGSRYRLHTSARGKPVVLPSGATAAVWLWKPDGCPGRVQRSAVLAQFDLAIGPALRLHVGGAALDVTCRAPVVGAPYVSDLPERGSGLTVTVRLPALAHRGSVLEYAVTLTNVGKAALPMRPCPAYTETIATVTIERHLVNCAAAPATLPPGTSVTFDMRIAVPPEAPVGPAKVGWTLDSGEGAGGVVTIG